MIRVSDLPPFLEMGDAFVDHWLGVPFKWDGRDQRGVDCWGLAVQFYAAVHAQHLPDWRRRDQGRAWIARTIAGEAKTHWQPIGQPENGSLIMAKAAAIVPHHIGIYWRGSAFHATEERGVVLERVAEFAAMHPNLEFGNYIP